MTKAESCAELLRVLHWNRTHVKRGDPRQRPFWRGRTSAGWAPLPSGPV